MRKFIHGVNWTVLQQVAYVSINYASLILLAWYLSPSDFGLMALSTVLIGFFEMLNGFGIPQLIIKDQIKDDLRIGYYLFVSLRLSVLLALFSAASGFLYVIWYGADVREILVKIIIASSTGILFNSIVAIYNALYQRDLDFKTPALFFVSGLLAGNIIALVVAAYGGSYWALVIRNLGPPALVMLGFIFFSRYKLKLHSRYRLHAEEKRFTLWLSSNQVINYLSRNLDYLIIGKFFEVGIVGQYSIAYRLMLFPMKFLSSRVQAVLYPTLARMLKQPDILMNFYVKIVSYIGFISFPLIGLASVLAPLWAPVMFDGDKYDYLVPLIQWMTLAGAFQAVTSPIGSLYLVHNLVRLMTAYSTVSAAIFVLGYMVGAWSGDIVVFATIYTILSVVVNFFAANYIPLRHLRYPYSTFLRATLQPLLPAAAAYACVWYMLQLWVADTHSEQLWEFSVLCVFFVLIYAAIYLLLFRKGLREKIYKLKTVYF